MDAFIFQKLNGLAFRSLWVDSLGIFFAEYLPYILVIGLVLFSIFHLKKNWKMVILALSAGALSRGIVEFVRFLWSRPRPFVDHEVNLLLEELNSYSFPSAHAAFFFAISTVVFCYNKKAGLVLFLISFMISGARIFGGVHWFYDILGGLLVGILSGLIMLMIAKVLKK